MNVVTTAASGGENKSPLPILRSPSHESINTNLSLFSMSSAELKNARGPSPNPERCARVKIQEPEKSPTSFFEEDIELLRTCAQLSAALGLRKSFSSSELSVHNGVIDSISGVQPPQQGPLSRPRNAVSEMALCCQQQLELLNTNTRLHNISRSCSTWVAIGDVQSSSQLPSPHTLQHGGGSNAGPGAAAFTPADLVRSVNKKVRQSYIQRRLLATCKALERMSKSDFNLEQLESQLSAVPAVALPSGGPGGGCALNHLKVPGSEGRAGRPRSKNLPLTIRDIEKEKGKPLSKYERNVMIFNWLHTLEDCGGIEALQ